MRVLTIMLLCGLSLCAQQEGEPSEGPLLWRLEGPTPSYLFATLAVPDTRVLELPDYVEQAFADSEALFAELPLDIRSQVAMSEQLLLPDGGTLEELLTGKQFLRVHKVINELGFPIDGFKTLRVWALTLTLPQLEQLRQALLDGDGTQPLDVYLYHRAIDEQKEVGGLESIEEHIALQDSTDLVTQVKNLEQALDRLDAQARGEDPLAGLVELFLAGDLEGIARAHRWGAEDAALRRAREQLSARRNGLLADRIAARMEQDPERVHFFALDCLHFVDEQDVRAMLRARGLVVTRVQAATASD